MRALQPTGVKPAIRYAITPWPAPKGGARMTATKSPYSADTVDRKSAFQSYAGLEELK